MKILRNCQ